MRTYLIEVNIELERLHTQAHLLRAQVASVEDIVWISGVIALAAVVQSLAGFGFALVAIALLPFFLDLSRPFPSC